MKNKIKIVLPCIIIILILFGCDLNNNPNSKVEEELSKYQMVDKNINTKDLISMLSNSSNLTQAQTTKYQKIIEHQYKDMSYEIKDETIEGYTATIKVQIEVYDYKKIISNLNANASSISIEEYNDKLIEELEKTKDKVTYTIEFIVLKDDKGNWKLDDLTNEQEEKLLGIY